MSVGGTTVGRFEPDRPSFLLGRRWKIVWALLYIVFCLLVLASVDDSHDWGGDFALYIIHARNLAEGADYARTEWVYNPADTAMSPRSYPPGLPLMLAPVYWLRGLDLAAFKMVVALCFLLSIPLIVVLLKKTFGAAVAMGAALLFALNPYVWNFHGEIRSDLPFLLLSLIALIVVGWRQDSKGWKAAGLSVLAGALIYSVYATRLPGIALLLAVVVYDLIQNPRKLHRTGLLTGTFLLLWIQPPVEFGDFSVYAPEGASTFDVALDSTQASCISCVPGRAVRYLFGLGRVFLGAPNIVLAAVGGVFALALVLGFAFRHLSILRQPSTEAPRWFILRFLRSFGPVEIYAIGFIGITVLAKYYDVRYMIPVFPFLFAYALSGSESGGARWLGKRSLVSGLLILGLLGVYGQQHVSRINAEFSEPQGIGIEAPASQELFAWVRDQVPDEALIGFQKPRVLTLFTGRRATIFDPVFPGEDLPQVLFEDFLERDVRYLVVSSIYGTNRAYPLDAHRLTAPPVPQAFELEYASDYFQVLRFKPEAARQILEDMSIDDGVSERPDPATIRDL